MPTQRILVIGSGPVAMGHGLEFGVATDEACKTLHELGHTVIVLDNRTSTLTPDMYSRAEVYCEPLSHDIFDQVLARERPHAVLASAGGAHAFNFIMQRHHPGAVAGPCPSLLGPSADILSGTQDATVLHRIAEEVGLSVPEASIVAKLRQGQEYGQQIGFPVVVHPRYAHGGVGTSIAYTMDELTHALHVALAVSPVQQAVVEKSLFGMKRTEWLVLRDTRGTTTCVGGMEYIEPLGIHSADSPAVTPLQSLTQEKIKEIEKLVCAATEKLSLYGSVTLQLAQCYDTDKTYIVSVEPYITRAAMWIGRATRVDCVQHHIRLAAGEALNVENIQNNMPAKDLFSTPVTPEPCCWCRLPLFPGKRLKKEEEELTTYSKSVGAVTGIGPDFLSAFLHAIHAAEVPVIGPGFNENLLADCHSDSDAFAVASAPTPQRLWNIYRCMNRGMTVAEIHDATHIDPWFLEELLRLHDMEQKWKKVSKGDFLTQSKKHHDLLHSAKISGCSDAQLARVINVEPERIEQCRKENGILSGPCVLSQDEETDRRLALTYVPGPRTTSLAPENQECILFLDVAGSLIHHGPTHAYIISLMISAFSSEGVRCVLLSPDALHEAAATTTPVRHYISPVTPENIAQIIELERPIGVVAHMDATQLEPLAAILEEKEIPLLNMSLDARRRVSQRNRFQTLLQKLDIRQPPHGVAKNARNAYVIAKDIGYPVMVHPANPVSVPRVAIWYDKKDAEDFLQQAKQVSEMYPLSIEAFIESGREYQVDAVTDGTRVAVVGILEHVEEAGVHNADSASLWPPRVLPPTVLDECKQYVTRIVKELNVRGMLSITLVVAQEKVYLLNILPGAARSSAFIHMMTGRKYIPAAVSLLRGATLNDQIYEECCGDFVAVRAPVFPFTRFPHSDASLGPEQCSIGEAVGIDDAFGMAFAKAHIATGGIVPTRGTALLSLADRDKNESVSLARKLRALGFSIMATHGTADVLSEAGILVDSVLKMHEGHPNAIDYLSEGKIQLVINTPEGKENRAAEACMRHEAVQRSLPVVTTIAGAHAMIEGIQSFMRHGMTVHSLSEYNATLKHQLELKLENTLFPE